MQPYPRIAPGIRYPFGSPERSAVFWENGYPFEDPRVFGQSGRCAGRKTRDGMKTRGYSATVYRYGFNGKELDGETTADAYDFGARIYDARLGRWLAVDPLAKENCINTVYEFVGNSCILAKDMDGNEQDIHLNFVEIINNCKLCKLP
jgi:RHS repeat-associated protein